MTDSSSVEEKQAQRDRPRLEFPILQAFPRTVAECRTYPVTTIVIAVCVVNFLLVNLVTIHAGSVVQDILVPGPVAIWAGAVWGLVTSAFVHVAWWHILFNMWWARDFGHLLEPDLGRRRYVGFILIGAIASSGWQLLTTGATGIGFSGVVYALFGYILARRRSRPTFREFLRSSTIFWLLGWLVFCVVLTIANGGTSPTRPTSLAWHSATCSAWPANAQGSAWVRWWDWASCSSASSPLAATCRGRQCGGPDTSYARSTRGDVKRRRVT